MVSSFAVTSMIMIYVLSLQIWERYKNSSFFASLYLSKQAAVILMFYFISFIIEEAICNEDIGFWVLFPVKKAASYDFLIVYILSLIQFNIFVKIYSSLSYFSSSYFHPVSVNKGNSLKQLPKQILIFSGIFVKLCISNTLKKLSNVQ